MWKFHSRGKDGTQKRKRTAKLLGLAMAAMVTLAACSNAVQPDRAATLTEGEVASEESQLPADFQISVYQGEETLGGQEINFSELVGRGQPVVLNAWAGLCPPCRLEMPDFQEVHDDFEGRILLLGLDIGPFTNLGTSENGRALVQELGVTYPIGTTPNVEVVRAYKLIGMPTTYFIKPNGEVHRQWTGLLTKDKLTELVQELIEASNSA
jgi:thiol-disulfide isomerase/thioredoxin